MRHKMRKNLQMKNIKTIKVLKTYLNTLWNVFYKQSWRKFSVHQGVCSVGIHLLGYVTI